MIRRIACAFVLFVAVPSDLLAQFRSDDPRVRRANRERAVAIAGTEARNFVETYDDDAVAAIFVCSKPTAARLAGFHNSGAISRLPRPRDLLRVIAQPRHRDDVALWAIQHVDELTEPDSFDAYLASPLEYALALKQLKAGAAEIRGNRLNPATATSGSTTKGLAALDSLTSNDRVGITTCLCLVILMLVAIWRRRRSPIL